MQRTLLIVEDVDTCAATLEMVFSGIEDLQVIVADSAERACELLEGDPPDPVAAVVTDLEMRGMGGFELIKRVRNGAHRDVPIVVITGSSDPDAPDQARKLGADAFFLKPYSPLVVRAKMEELLNHHEKPHEIPAS